MTQTTTKALPELCERFGHSTRTSSGSQDWGGHYTEYCTRCGASGKVRTAVAGYPERPQYVTGYRLSACDCNAVLSRKGGAA